jgi:hypothetical protein
MPNRRPGFPPQAIDHSGKRSSIPARPPPGQRVTAVWGYPPAQVGSGEHDASRPPESFVFDLVP